MVSGHAQRERLLRLKRAEWRWQDRQRDGYSTYRAGRPQVKHSSQYSQRKQLVENLVAVAALALVVLCAALAGGVTGF